MRKQEDLERFRKAARRMDGKTRENLRDAGCDEELIAELETLPGTCAQLCRLKTYRRDLLDGIHVEQRKLECLDYLIYQLRCDTERSCLAQAKLKGEQP